METSVPILFRVIKGRDRKVINITVGGDGGGWSTGVRLGRGGRNPETSQLIDTEV